MLEAMRRGQRWLTGIFVGVIGLVFAAFIGLGGPLSSGGPAGNAVVEVDGHGIGLAEFEQARGAQEARFREALGDQYDSEAAADYLDSQALGLLVNREIMAQTARDLGLRASKEEIQDWVRKLYGDATGQIDQDQLVSYVKYTYGSEKIFLEVVRRDLLGRKLGQLLYAQAKVSDGEAGSAALQRLEAVRIAFVALDTEHLPPGKQVPEEDVQAYREAHAEELEERYRENIDEYQVPEQVRVRHILLLVPEDADEEAVEEVRKRAEFARVRVEAGAAFEEVAEELSEDPGSRERGGDLGFIARGETAPAVEEVAFSLEPGALSKLVRSDAGFHVIRTEEKREARETPFEEVALDLAQTGAESEAAGEVARELSERLVATVREGESLENSARGLGLTLERTPMLRRRPDGFIPGLGASPEALATAFTLDLEAPSSPRVFAVDNKLILIQLLERASPEPDALADATAAEKERILDRKRNDVIEDWIDNRREKLLAANRLVVNADLIQSGR